MLFRSVDPNPVRAVARVPVSVSREVTFGEDVTDLDELRRVLRSHAERVGADLRRAGRRARTVTLPAATEPRIYRDWWIDNRNLLKKVTPAALPVTTGDSYTYENGQLTLKLVVQASRDYAQVEICTTDLCK